MVLYNTTSLLSTAFGLHCGKRFANHDQARARKPENLLGLKGKRLATFRSDSIMICRRMTAVSLKTCACDREERGIRPAPPALNQPKDLYHDHRKNDR